MTDQQLLAVGVIKTVLELLLISVLPLYTPS